MYLFISGVLFALTHQYKLTLGQNGERYYNRNDGLTEIPTDIPPNVIEVYISSKQITTIRANVLLQLSQCKYLSLGRNISDIEPGAFEGLTSLTNLSLGYNRLERLYSNMFSGVNNCKWLDLQENQITEIEPRSFDGLSNLEWLGLNINRLTILRTGTFWGLSKCTQILLWENRISKIEAGSFKGLSALRILSMYDNKVWSDYALTCSLV